MKPKLLDLPPRGLTLLHACQPEARKQVEVISDIVIEAGLRRPALNILCSGDFGWDCGYITALIQKYSQGGRSAQVLFYLTNGPAARHWQTQAMEGFGSRLAPEQFRRKILTDGPFQHDFQELARRLAGIIAQIHHTGGQAFVVPQLEDNQTDESFKMMLQLCRDALPPDLPVHFGRNPCISCYPGNQGGLPVGCFLEEHHHSSSCTFTVENGIVANDGCTYAFPGEQPVFTPYLPLADLAGVQSRTGRLNSTFLLWSAKYQGLGLKNQKPKDRDYILPTDEEKALLRTFLQRP